MPKEINALKTYGEYRKVGASGTAVKVLEYDMDGNISRAQGATVPTDADAGYAVGCVFIDTTGGIGVTYYVNEGSATSCDFNVSAGGTGDITSVVAGAGLTGGGVTGAVTLDIANTDGKITVGANSIDITAVSLVNADVAVAAAIDWSKMAALTANYILAGVAGVATVCEVAGDVSMTAAGTTATFVVSDVTIGADAQYDMLVRGATSYGRMAVGTAAQILMCNATPAPAWTTVGGDATIGATGTVSVTDLTITGEAAGDILYFNGVNWVRLAKPGAGTWYLQGGTTPTWSIVSAGIASDLSATVTVQNATNDLVITSTDQTAVGESVVIPDFNAGGAAHTFAFLNVAQTFTANQTIQYGHLLLRDNDEGQTLQILLNENMTADNTLTILPNDGSRNISMKGNLTISGDLITVGDDSVTLTTTAATNVTLPTAGTLATLGGAEILSTKTLIAPKIATTDGIFDAGGDAYLKFIEDAAAKTFVVIETSATTVAPKIYSDGDTADIGLKIYGKGSGKVTICDAATPTKMMNFELVGATATKTMQILSSHTNDRIITLPDATDTLVGKATADVFTNKTYDCDGAGNVLSNVNAEELDSAPITAGNATKGVVFSYTLDITNVGGDTTIIANPGFKFVVLDAWSINKSADGGTWQLKNSTSGNFITNQVTVGASDLDIDRATQIDDAEFDIGAAETLAVTSNAGLDAKIVVVCMRSD